ncbi:MAG: hypothetical protein SWE60_11870 [Thermodesulfobacteriota bacterium]|nr:hypothetical protein [Thermodesulfobacteriota bacterium]
MLLVLVLLGYSAVQRPVIVMASGPTGMSVQNTGSSDALIYRVDGFWFWGGKVAMLRRIPSINQQVEPGMDPVRLQIPPIPGPQEEMGREGPWYMRLVIHYGIPHLPVLRYTTLLHFEFDATGQKWASVEAIPPKHRALGSLGLGNVGKIDLDFR